VRLPNFLSVQPKPFDQQFYEDEEEEDSASQVLDEEGRARLRLRVENTIRWRTVVDEVTGEERRESNARFVKYSDGSLMMQVGTELFDATSMPLSDFNHLFIRQGTGLQGQAVFKQKLTFRPTSVHSLTHKKIMTKIVQRDVANVSKVKLIPMSGDNPETARDKLWREEEEKLKRHEKERGLRARQAVKQLAASGNKLSGDYLDGDQATNAIKQKYRQKNVKASGAIYSSDSDESDEGPRKSVPKRPDLSDSSDSDSDSEDESPKKSKKSKPTASSDDDSDKDYDSDKESGKATNKLASDSDSDEKESEDAMDDKSDNDSDSDEEPPAKSGKKPNTIMSSDSDSD